MAHLMNASRRFRSPVQLKPASATRMHAEQHDLGYHDARQAFRQLTTQAYWGAIGVPAKHLRSSPRDYLVAVLALGQSILLQSKPQVMLW